jgi:hypothetical protein
MVQQHALAHRACGKCRCMIRQLPSTLMTALARSFRNWYTARLTIRATKDRAVLSNKDKDCLKGLPPYPPPFPPSLPSPLPVLPPSRRAQGQQAIV